MQYTIVSILLKSWDKKIKFHKGFGPATFFFLYDKRLVHTHLLEDREVLKEYCKRYGNISMEGTNACVSLKM